MRTSMCEHGFFEGHRFTKESKQQFKERWNKMTDQEKIEFINEKIDRFEEHEDRFSIKSIDARCERWMNMTTQEKEEFIDEHKKKFHHRMQAMHPFLGHMHP